MCEEIYTQYQTPYFNLTGGGELVASAVTLWAAKHSVTLFYIDVDAKKLIPLTGDDLTDYPIEMPSLSVAEVIALSGGEYKRSDHLQPDFQDQALLNMIDSSFRVFLKSHS